MEIRNEGQNVNSKIPKRIIQVWGGNREISLFSKASAVNIKLLNPDFEYLFFDDEGIDTFINKYYPQYLSVFNSFRFPIQRFDFFRYLAIYQLGGFYFDMDIFLAKDISELLEFECVFPFEELTINKFFVEEYRMDWEIGNYAFGATAGHPFLLAIIENCIRAQEDPDWAQPMLKRIPKLMHDEFRVLNTSGPGLVSRTLAEYTKASEQVKVLFPNNVSDISNWNCFGAYGIHLHQGTWRQTNFLLRRLMSTWTNWERKKAISTAIKLGMTRSVNEITRKS